MRTILILLASAVCSFAAPLSGPITADGTYTVPTVRGQGYVFAVSGSFGGGSLAINWNDGNQTAYPQSPATAGETWTFTAASNQVDLVLTGATSPELTVSVSLANGLGGLATAAQGALADSALQAASIKGVVVSKKDGTRTAYPPSADTDTARGLALEAAFAAAVAGDTIDLSPGNYYVAKATSSIAGIVGQFAILDRMTIRLNGARLYKKSTDTASAMFACSAATLINDWSIIGPGVIEGSYYATSDTSARGANTSEIGVEVRACRRARIENISILNFAGSGIEANSTSDITDIYGTGTKISRLHVHGCNIDKNNVGYGTNAGNEYHLLTNCTFNANQTACYVAAGNIKFVGCDASNNTNFALRIIDGGNDGHGAWVGGNITHNTGFAVDAQANMNAGFLFSSVVIAADSNTTNKIQSLGGGLIFTNCYIDSPIYASSTPTGINVIANCFISGSYTAITDLSAAERAKWKFKNNYTLTGVWASDDIRTTYATDGDAGTGGVLQGEMWQQTTTGAVFIKL